jgi:hypothetical protein
VRTFKEHLRCAQDVTNLVLGNKFSMWAFFLNTMYLGKKIAGTSKMSPAYCWREHLENNGHIHLECDWGLIAGNISSTLPMYIFNVIRFWCYG